MEGKMGCGFENMEVASLVANLGGAEGAEDKNN